MLDSCAKWFEIADLTKETGRTYTFALKPPYGLDDE